MLSSTWIGVLSLACIIGGIVMVALKADMALTMSLIVSGTGALGAMVHGLRRQAETAKEVATEAKREAKQAIEETQTLRRDMLKPPTKT